MRKQPSERKPARQPKSDVRGERQRRGQPAGKAAEQLGATEEQVKPLTPPMARSDEQPNDPERGAQPDKGLDPADELTPG